METHGTQQTSHTVFADTELLELIGVRQIIHAHFDVRQMYVRGPVIRFEATALRGAWRTVRGAAGEFGYRAYLQRWGQNRFICTMVKRERTPDPARRREMRIALIMFGLTVFTTITSNLIYGLLGIRVFVDGLSSPDRWNVIIAGLTQPGRWVEAIVFCAALLFILGTHEMGHKLAAWRNGIDASPPKFIPMPWPFMGTMGAFIRLRSPMPDANAAVEMGLSGPLFGFLAALPVLALGIYTSGHFPAAPIQNSGGEILFEPIIFRVLAYHIIGIPSGHMIMLNSLGFAGWIGLLLTMMNLLPIGQLDGGHIVRSLLTTASHRFLSYAIIAVVIAMGVVTHYFGWYVWAFLTSILMRYKYPPYAGATEPMRFRNILFALIGLAIFILCFMPVPIS